MASNETPLTLVGNLTDDPDLRFTPSGAALVKFTVASTPRQYDRTSESWKDGEAMFMYCSAWRELAENVAESLRKGSRVVVTGRLKQRRYETTEGEKRSVFELDVEDVGPSLKYAQATVKKMARKSDIAAGGAGREGYAADPWATTGKAAKVQDTEPPF